MATRRDLIRQNYKISSSPTGLALMLSALTGECVTVPQIRAVYMRYPDLRRELPIWKGPRMSRLLENDDAITDIPDTPFSGVPKDVAAAYDAAAPGVRIIDVTNDHCRWPVREGFFCGHPVKARGRYCEHHTLRASRPK